MSQELRPCPFCGGKAEFERLGTGRVSCIVVCADCGARHESGDSGEHNGASWNQRTEDAALAKVAVLTEERDAAEGKREMAYRAYSDVLRELDEQTKDHKIVQENAGKVINDQRDHIVELQARLAELDPPWSDDPPTVPGEYEWAQPGLLCATVVTLNAEGRIVDWLGDDLGPRDSALFAGCRWRPAPKTRDPWKGE